MSDKTTKSEPVSAGRLKSFIERVERLLVERQALQSDIKDVFSEAKGVGYDVKTMRALIKIRAQDTADRAEQAALLDTYAHALGMEPIEAARAPTEEELEERAGRILVEVDRCMELVQNGKPPKIAAIQELIGCSLGKASKLRNLVADRISRSAPIIDENENLDIRGEETADFRHPPDEGSGTAVPSSPAPVPVILDELEMPPFLDRRVRA